MMSLIALIILLPLQWAGYLSAVETATLYLLIVVAEEVDSIKRNTETK